MRWTRLLRTETFRLAAWSATLFMLFAALLASIIYYQVRDSQFNALAANLDADIKTIANGYQAEGLREAVEVVQQLLGTPDYASTGPAPGYIFLRDARQGKVAGNLASLPITLGPIEMPDPAPDPAHRRQGRVIGKGVMLAEGVYLFVGRETYAIEASQARLLGTLLRISLLALLLAIAGGVLFSARFMRRIDAMTRTCKAIVAGRFGDRMPLRGSGDELDQLAESINAMLDRISALLDNLRQVSSDVAHDLRTPLTHLRQRLEAAQAGATTAQDYAQAVQGAIEDADQLLGIFAALLRISQIESGTRAAAFSSVDLGELLNRVHDLYRPLAEDQSRPLLCDAPAGMRVRGDAELLLQLFCNLVENALRHTPPGSRIGIDLRRQGDAVVASVADAGAGIPAAERDKVLRRFYRLAASRSTPGNGLGLALVAAIAALHAAPLQLGDEAPGLRVSVRFPALRD